MVFWHLNICSNQDHPRNLQRLASILDMQAAVQASQMTKTSEHQSPRLLRDDGLAPLLLNLELYLPCVTTQQFSNSSRSHFTRPQTLC